MTTCLDFVTVLKIYFFAAATDSFLYCLTSFLSSRVAFIGSKGYGISIFCDNVFIKDDVMYVVLNIENKSATTYSLSEPRFSIESRKRTKRGLVYKKQVFPKNILGMEPIAPSTQSRMVFSFDKFKMYVHPRG